MPRNRSPLAVQSSKGRSIPVSAQRLVNLYAEQNAPDAKSKVVLHGTPGLLQFADLSGNGRGITVLDETLYAVVGSKLYSATAGGTVTQLGDVPGLGPVKMVPSRDEIFLLLNNNTGYLWDGSTVSQITDPDFPTPSDVTYQDGYFIVSKGETDTFYVSSLFDGSTWDGTDFATAEALGDRIVGLVSDRSELWIFGIRSTEIWYNSGNADFPFARRQVVQRGCIARDSITRLNNTIISVGDDGIVYQWSGYAPQRISTHAVEYAIGQMANKGDISGYSYSQEGHTFYVMRLLMETWVYDTVTGLWHERESYGRDNYRVADAVEAFGKVICLDHQTDKLYELDLDTYTEDGTTLIATAQSAPLHAERYRAFMPRFEVEAEMGVGVTTGQGSDPTVELSYSDDGGFTWSTPKFRSLGPKGEYRKRAYWHRLGSFRQRTMRVRISDPVKRAITAMVADVDVGNG